MLDIIDDRTPNEQLALPHPRNRLEQDVLRLRDALLAIDAALQEKAANSDLDAAMNALQQGINGLSTSVNTLQQSKVGVVNGKPGPVVTLTAADIGALGLGQYGFGAEALPVDVADLDLASARTQFFMGSAMLHAPLGSAGFFLIFQLVRGPGWVTQMAFGMSDLAGHIFMRQKLDGVWSPQWREVSGRLPVRYVDDTGGGMYGAVDGGLNLTNVWRHAGGAILKRAPNPSADGDVFGIVITNGRLDNQIQASAGGSKVMGAADHLVLDKPGPYTFKYFQALNDWRLF